MTPSKETLSTPKIVAVVGLIAGLTATWIYCSDAGRRSAIRRAAAERSLFVEPERVDLGVIKSDQVQSVSFTFTNGSSSTADTIVVHESCGCTVAKNKPEEIKSGEVAVLNAEFNPRGRKGPSEVFLLFDYRLAGRRQQTLLRISADIVESKAPE